MKNICFLLWLMVPFFACNQTKDSPEKPELKGKSFVMKTYNGIANSADSFPNGMPVISFSKDTSLSGKTGCNDFFGSYSVSENHLKLNITGMTKMFCMGVDETGFLQAAKSTDSFLIKDTLLHLFHSGKEIMVLKQQ